MQGTADDIMKIAGHLLLRNLYLVYPDIVRPIAEVHDEFLMDIKAEYKDFISEKVRYCLEEAMPKYIEEHFEVKVNIPFKCSIEVGKSWGEAK
jgi:DNA polymerase I-like protein with 3'-5' exonuclease and polymerase domains